MARTKKITTKNTHSFARTTTDQTVRWAETVNTTWSTGGTDVAVTGLDLDIVTGVFTKTFHITYRDGRTAESAREISPEFAQGLIGVWGKQFGN